MKQILPHPLWVGHAGDGQDVHKILETGIQAVVQLAAEEPSLQLPRDLISCRFPLVDGPGNRAALLLLAVDTVTTLLRMRVATLLCCGAGLSRSPAIAAAALAIAGQQSLEQGLECVVQHHSCDVVPGLWNELVEHLRTRSSHRGTP